MAAAGAASRRPICDGQAARPGPVEPDRRAARARFSTGGGTSGRAPRQPARRSASAPSPDARASTTPALRRRTHLGARSGDLAAAARRSPTNRAPSDTHGALAGADAGRGSSHARVASRSTATRARAPPTPTARPRGAAPPSRSPPLRARPPPRRRRPGRGAGRSTAQVGAQRRRPSATRPRPAWRRAQSGALEGACARAT